MTAESIKQIAYCHFAQKGYEGASLAEIATDAGIKKPSIYNHFKSKEDLYFSCLADSTAITLAMVEDYLAVRQEQPLPQTLLDFLHFYPHAVLENPTIHFSVIATYFPPAIFRERLVQFSNDSMDHLTACFRETFAAQSHLLKQTPSACAIAFLCIVDGLMVELLWGGAERCKIRLEAIWPAYWQGVGKNAQKNDC